MPRHHHKPVFSGDMSATIASNGTTVSGVGVVTVQNSRQYSKFHVENPSRTHVYKGLYGELVMLQDGHWTYTLNAAHPAVAGLTTGQTLTDSFAVRPKYVWKYREFFPVTITIEGAA